MARSPALDPTRSAHRAWPLVRLAFLLAIAATLASNTRAQTTPAPSLSAQAQQLFAHEQWQDVVHLIENSSINANVSRDADLYYYYGESLAKLGRLDSARQSFLAGSRLSPRDSRFPIEIGGIEFLRKHYAEAAHWLLIGSKLTPRNTPDDTYVNDFAGSVFYLLGNPDAALKYWNRVNKPGIANVSSDPVPQLDPILLDRTFSFAPATTLQLSQWQQTKARLQALGIFPAYNLVLSARPDQRFDVTLHASQRNGWGASKYEALLSTFRGVFYQTLTPEYYNIDRSATNVVSLLRWDAQKRRAFADLSGPLHRDPRWRYHLALDLRGENWDIRNSFTGSAPVLASLNLRRESLQANITSIHALRWNWTTGAELSHRDLRDVNPGTTLPPDLLLRGWQLKNTARLQYRLLDVPERRLTIATGASSELSRIWSSPLGTSFKPQAFLSTHWFPRAQGDDLEMLHQVRAGAIAGTIPFDELFMLGLERDNDLPMRAHIGTRDGRKGSAPLGRRYLLSNWEIDKNLYSNGLFSVKLGPFLDTGSTTGPATLGSHKWLWDTGLQLKLSALGVKFIVSYGRDLRAGKGAFYLRTFR